MMMSGLQVPVLEGVGPDALGDWIREASRPTVLKGLVSRWPVVRAAGESRRAAADYLRGFYRNATVGAWLGGPEIDGRFFYTEDLSGFNYRAVMMKFDAVLDLLERHAEDPRPPAIYVGSTTVDTCLPGFRAENDLRLDVPDALASLWIGNRTRVAAHYDFPDNIACVVAGRRRFTLFPPDQIRDLYVGPIDFTPAGQPVSLVDVAKPDLARFPRFANAMQHALVAELEAGDAIFIPSMWWHHVEAQAPFNVLLNYWWRSSPAYRGNPADVLLHALLGMAGLRPDQLAAWRGILDHYVFDPDSDAFAHIPERRRGVLGRIDEDRARALRARLLSGLNR